MWVTGAKPHTFHSQIFSGYFLHVCKWRELRLKRNNLTGKLRMDKPIVIELAAILAIFGNVSIYFTSALSFENEVVKHGTKSKYDLHFM